MKRSIPSGADVGSARPSAPVEARLAPYDVVCFSHLRWDFVFQRPHHLMTRHARTGRAFYVEEPVYDAEVPRLEVRSRKGGVTIAVPHLPADVADPVAAQRHLVDDLLAAHHVRDFVAWYYTPMALRFTRHLRPAAVVYDCMDELSAFRGAPAQLPRLERELFARADVVFVGGQSLYEAKRGQHPNLHAFPSSIDREHFATAEDAVEPADQQAIPHPRLGFFGVIDERMDLALLDELAHARPDWQFVLVGPIAKIDPADLPDRPNVHHLGPKPYEVLPAYLSGWDVALLPFAANAATRYISPTKTPEYLAAGRPVVSAPIRDVVRPYGRRGLVRIALTASDWLKAIEATLAEDPARTAWREDVDDFLASTSWDRTWARMSRHVGASLERTERPDPARIHPYGPMRLQAASRSDS